MSEFKGVTRIFNTVMIVSCILYFFIIWSECWREEDIIRFFMIGRI